MSLKFNFSWQPLTLGDLELLRQSLIIKNPEVSELNLANLFIWREFDRPTLARLDDYLLIRLNPPNEHPYLLEPLGPPPPPSFLFFCLQETGRFSRLPEKFLSFLPQKGITIKENRDQFDYLYQREVMAKLQGKKYDGKRNLIRRFLANFPNFEFRLLNKNWKKEALGFFFSWAGQKGSSENFFPLSLEDQAKALEIAFELWEELGLMGQVLLVKGELKGFIIGSRLNENTIVVHFLYADRTSPGASQLIFREACQNLFHSFPLVNLEQDLGLPGLRRAKLSYHPFRLMAKYDVYLAKNEK
ncbi:MAG: phosphatidylglycerol lysyltransferase domain-containing protein [Candidatus Aminicenantes bacterium]|nr:phosphatidylglycerol lysyltransferase domain-containing protein [Candidatus Aminicenantes bacterium]